MNKPIHVKDNEFEKTVLKSAAPISLIKSKMDGLLKASVGA
jgi:hypothetical protein